MKRYFLYSNKKYQEEQDKGIISKCTYFKKCLVISRMMAQYAIDEYNKVSDEYNRITHMKSRFKHQGVAITTLEAQIAFQSKLCKEIRGVIAALGGMICASLNGWQYCGASYDDLFNFCCCSEKSISDMKKSISEGVTDFSKLVFNNSPDYKVTGEWFEMTCYAPLTHSIREYMLAEIKKTCKDRNIADKINEKIFETFPELMDCLMIKSTDEIFTDLDGLPIDFEQ